MQPRSDTHLVDQLPTSAVALVLTMHRWLLGDLTRPVQLRMR